MFHKVGLSLQVDLKIQQRALRVKMYQRRQIVLSLCFWLTLLITILVPSIFSFNWLLKARTISQKKAYYDFVQLFTEDTSNYNMYYLTDLSVHPPDKSVIPPGVTEVSI
jgi:hypothetical protein